MIAMRLFAGLLIGLLFAALVLFGVCRFAPFAFICGHAAPGAALGLWILGSCLAWGALFGARAWRGVREGPPDYRE